MLGVIIVRSQIVFGTLLFLLLVIGQIFYIILVYIVPHHDCGDMPVRLWSMNKIKRLAY